MTGSRPSPPRETQTPPTVVPTAAPTAAPLPPPPLGSPRPTSDSSAPAPMGTRVLISRSPTMTGGPSRTTAPVPTPASTPSETGVVVRHSRPGRLDILNWLIDVEKLPDEAVDGVPCSHYRGRADRNSHVDMLIETYKREGGNISELEPGLFDLMRRQEIDVELWIDGEDYIRQFRIEGRLPKLPDLLTRAKRSGAPSSAPRAISTSTSQSSSSRPTSRRSRRPRSTFSCPPHRAVIYFRVAEEALRAFTPKG